MAVIFRDKFSPKFQQEFSPKFQQEFLPKFQNFGSNLNKIFYKILANLNILPIFFAVVLLSLLQYYCKNPVRNLVWISAILLLKYCYTFSYRNSDSLVTTLFVLNLTFSTESYCLKMYEITHVIGLKRQCLLTKCCDLT